MCLVPVSFIERARPTSSPSGSLSGAPTPRSRSNLLIHEAWEQTVRGGRKPVPPWLPSSLLKHTLDVLVQLVVMGEGPPQGGILTVQHGQ